MLYILFIIKHWGLIVIILADFFGGFILPFLNLPLFSKPKVADLFFEI
jgi:hypothetical protein